MRGRSSTIARVGTPVGTPVAASLDLVILAVERGTLVVLVEEAAMARRITLPSGAVRQPEPLAQQAATMVRTVLGRPAAWLAQAGALGDDRPHPAGSALSVVYAALCAAGTPAPAGMRWITAESASGLAGRQASAVRLTMTTIRDRMDLEPVAFRLLPPTFTLSDLQATYELLLGRRLHKASFRRALQAASLVVPTDVWRSEGRGRPAQLYRYAPRHTSGRRRSVRFELLG